MNELFPSPTRTVMNGKPVFTLPSRTVINFESGFRHKLLCDGPTFSTGSACVYRCAFCYVPDMMRKLRPHLESQGVTGAHEDVVIRREAALDTLRRQLHSKAALDLQGKRTTIFSSPLVDVAGNMDLVRETVAACKLILEHTDWDIRLLSKSNLLPKVALGLESEFANRKSEIQNRMIFGVSTGTLDDRLALAFEEGTPKPSKRIESLHWLQDHGWRTYGMICPSLPFATQLEYFRFAEECARAIRADRCEHVWAEVINVRGESFTRTRDALRAGGFQSEAARLETVMTDPEEWEEYARHTFNAHAYVLAGQRGPEGGPRLRFLQYATGAAKQWWQAQTPTGAILL